MIISIAQLNPTVGHIEKNYQQIKEVLKANSHSELIIFPELFLIGYPPLDLLFRSDFLNKVQIYHKKIALLSKHTSNTIVIGSISPSPHNYLFYNSAIIFKKGKEILTYHKQLLPQNNIYDERRYFISGSPTQKTTFQIKNITYQVCICADIWFNSCFSKEVDYPYDPLEKEKEVDWIINLSASPFCKGKIQKRHQEIQKKFKNSKVGIIFVNQWGGQDDLIFDGSSFISNPKKNIHIQASSFKDEVLNINLNSNFKKLPTPQFLQPLEEIYQALINGIRDYTQKTGFQKVIIGLSGGIDSTLITFLATQALGKDNIHTWTLPTNFSSKESIEDSLELAKKLNITCLHHPIKDILKQYEIENPSIKKGSLAHQNLQARIRGTFLMAQANQQQALLLATGNKSELSVGYSTLYGDMNGALLPIGDLYKTEVYQLTQWIQEKTQLIPSRILTKEPSAELTQNQKDIDNLPPYKDLDIFLHQYIDLKNDKALIKNCPDTTKNIIAKIEKNEFKRRQAPPILKISQECLGMGRRIPITNQYQIFLNN